MYLHSSVLVTLLIWVNVLTEQFLQGNVPLRHLLNEEMLFMSCRRSVIKEVGKWLGPQTVPYLARKMSYIFFNIYWRRNFFSGNEFVLYLNCLDGMFMEFSNFISKFPWGNWRFFFDMKYLQVYTRTIGYNILKLHIS